MHFVDSHCHLDDRQFAGDRDVVLERAREAGLKYILGIGTGDGPPDLEGAIRIADAFPFVFATIGIHPNDAPKANENTFSHLQDLLAHPKVVALGEIGLDYHWGVPKEIQEPLFRRQLEIAADARMPIVIHTRDAWEDTLMILRQQWAFTKLPCVMHCFTGDTRQAEECLQLGFYLAFGGVTTFPKSGPIRDAARITPAEPLLLQPYPQNIAPVPPRGKRNEPAFLTHTAATIATVRGESREQVAKETTANFQRIFGQKLN